jgi:uncharacterized protein (TIGR02145 family)
MRNLLSFVCFFSLINLNFNAQTGSITDKREGKTYKTVLMQTGRKSGPQTWLAENLVATKFKNGEPITEAKSPEEWMSLFKQGKPAWSYPDYNPEYLKYGILYNWYAIFDQRGIAPEGYRVANYEDWAIIGHYETYKDYTVTHDHGIDYNADISCYNNPPLPNYQNFMSADWREYYVIIKNLMTKNLLTPMIKGVLHLEKQCQEKIQQVFQLYQIFKFVDLGLRYQMFMKQGGGQ